MAPSCMDGPRCARGFVGLGDWSGAVMYSAFRARLHDRWPRWVSRIGLPTSRRALFGRRDDGAECPDPGPDHFAVAFLGSLLSLPSTGFDRRKRIRLSPQAAAAGGA